MTDSLLLDQTTWDLCLDASGNIAVASDPYAAAQDVACALRLWFGELWYDTSKGVPYRDQILGAFPPAPFLQAQFIKAAESVKRVLSAQCFITSMANRVLQGYVVFTTDAGDSTVAFVGDSQGLTTTLGAG